MIEFVVAVHPAGLPASESTGHFPDAIEAADRAMRAEHAVGRFGSVVRVRPVVETAFLHGKLRYPDELHPQASPEARRGWDAADKAAQEADSHIDAMKASGEWQLRRWGLSA